MNRLCNISTLRIFLISVLLGYSSLTLAVSGFRVNQIRVTGAQRVPASTVLSYLPIKRGQYLSSSDSANIIQTLYDTGFFSDIQLQRRGNTLIIKVAERSTIGTVRVIGNHSLPKKLLNQALKQVGLVSGQVLDQSKLRGIVEGLRQQYFNLGHYNAKVTPHVLSESRNRVSIKVQVQEGPVAKIEGIRIIGNHRFTERQLLRQFKLSTPSILSILTHNDEYSKQKLDTDLQSLTSYYMDRGYFKFSIISQQVSIAGNAAGIYIVIGINEGSLYHFSGFNVIGNPAGQKNQISKLIKIEAGDMFSRKVIFQSNHDITRYLGDRGYAFPRVNPVPKIDDVNHLVFLDYSINPGKKIYIRRIEFSGNSSTKEEVYRKRFTQFEGSLYSLSNIEDSRRVVSNLTFVSNIQSKLKPVAGTNNQADLRYMIKPNPQAAKATVQGGYSDTQGFMYGANLAQPNFLGTGNFASLSFQRSAYADSYSFSYSNPYATTWGASRNISVFYTKTKPSGSLNYANYDLNSYGISLGYGIPVSKNTFVNSAISYEHNYLKASGDNPVYNDFLEKYGQRYDQIGLSLGLTRNHYDTYPFPTSGSMNSLSSKIWFPVTKKSLSYYTVTYQSQLYFPIYNGFIGHLRGVANYGNGFSNTDTLPFFRNFYAGGLSTVPGFDPNSLGPKDAYGNALGGNILLVGQTSLIFPNGISENLRTALTFAAGNVFDQKKSFNLNNVRYSAGLTLTFLAPFLGPIQLGVAFPFHTGSDKGNVNMFGFSMGANI